MGDKKTGEGTTSGRLVKTTKVGVYRYVSSTRRYDGKPDQCFYIKYKVGGVKHVEKVGWASERYSAELAAEIRAERLREKRHGHMPAVQATLPPAAAEPPITLDGAWERYRDDHLIKLKTEGKTEGCLYKKYLADLGTMPLADFRLQTLLQLRATLDSYGKSPATVVHCLSLLRRIVNYSLDLDLFPGPSPFPRTRALSSKVFPALSNQRLRWLTAAEAKALLADIRRRSLRWYAISLWSLHTGARLGEILSLRAHRVDQERHTARLVDTKTGLDRTIYLTPTCLDALKLLPPPNGRDALLFPGQQGQQSRHATGTFVTSVQALGFNAHVTDRLEKVVFHSLRHTFASWLVMAGVDLYMVSRLLGHTSIETTMRYAHLSPKTKAEAIQNIERVFHGDSPPKLDHPGSGEPASPDTWRDLFGGIG